MLLVFQLISVIILFSVIGEPLRIVIRHYSSLFRKLNVLQMVVVDVYLGGLILYSLALVPLGLFNAISVWAITLISAIFVTVFYLRKFKVLINSAELKRTCVRVVTKNYVLTHKGTLLECLIVLAIFSVALWVQVTPVSKFVFGSIHDTSLHALFVELILENEQVPATHQPYLPAAIIYPQAAHVIFAYSSYIFGFIPPKAVFYLTPLFSATTVLAAYYLGKKLGPTQGLGVIFAFIMAFVSMWPQFMTWGSNPFIVGFPLFLVCLGFLPSLPDLLDRSKMVEICVIGILFGYSASLHLGSYEVLIASAIIWLLVEAFHKHVRIRGFRNFLVMCALSLLPIAPYLYRFVKYYPYPGHNIGLPNDLVTDFTSPPTTHGHPFQSPIVSILVNFPIWLVSCYNVYPDFALRILWICLAFASFLPVFVSLRRKRTLLSAEKIVLVNLIAVFLLNFCTFIMPAIPWSRICFLLYASVCLLVATLNVRLYPVFRAFFMKVFRDIVKKDQKKMILTSFMATLLLFSALYSPFICYTILKSPGGLRGLYSMYAVTTESDYETMIWMKYNLLDNVTILITTYESGGFIPSVSQKKVIFPFTSYLFSYSYRRLIDLIQRGVVNETTYELMNHFKISHVFLGSQAVQYWGTVKFEENPKWDSLLFLGNPNFKLVKNVGNSYLFKLTSKPNSSIVFQEDFENLSLTQMGWRSGQIGYGNYSMNITCNGNSKVLRMTALKNQTSRWLYACWLDRKVYLADTSNVTLSFDLNVSVSPPNAVELSVFNANRMRHLTFATQSILYQNQSNVLELQPPFNFNLSEIWMEKFCEPLPNVIIIELAVVNVDATSPTIAFFDNITLTINEQET